MFYLGIFLFFPGLLLIPFGQWLTTAVKHVFLFSVMDDSEIEVVVPNDSTRYIAILVIIVGIVLTDYTSDALQNPSRAYLLDVCRAGEFWS